MNSQWESRPSVILWSTSKIKADDAVETTASSSSSSSPEHIISDSKQPHTGTTFSPGAAQNSDFDVVPVMDEDPLLLIDGEDECFVGFYDNTTDIPSCVPLKMVTLPTHSNAEVNTILSEIQDTLRDMHDNNNAVDASLPERIQQAKVKGRLHEYIYANNYVDMGKIDTYVEPMQGCIFCIALHEWWYSSHLF